MQRDAEELPRDPRYPSKGEDPVWRGLARWRRTSVGAVVRAALEHYLDEGVGGRAGRPLPVRYVVPGEPAGPELDLAEAYADAAADADGGADGGTVAEEE